MAQSNSVQREPSMEEILASIRRIIEDSDTPRAGDEQDDEASPAGRFTSADIRDFEAFRAGIQPPTELSGSDLSAAPTREADDEAPSASSAFRSSSDELRPSFAADGAERVPEKGAAASAGAEIAPTAREPQVAHAAPAAAAEAEASADYDEALLGFQDLLDSELKQMPELRGTSGQTSIVSDRTGRQVAAAFGELSEAFAATRQKSFDEMAEAMIRPMLSEWLDNNLPTLVERLVREEIERIARGPAA